MVEWFGWFDVFVNNVGEQYLQLGIEDVLEEQFECMFCINVYGMFFCMQVVLLYMKVGGCIVNMVLVIVYYGSLKLFDYLVIKGVIVVFIWLLLIELVECDICVNVVVLGLIWMLLILLMFMFEQVVKFGLNVLFKWLG